MISLYAVFWVMVGLFALIGFLRGWSKEVIALAGLILSLFALKQFGWFLVNLVGSGSSGEGAAVEDLMAAMRSQFYVLSTIHLIIAFFSYQGVALASQRLSGREGLQERLLGLIVGAVNGYLIVGTLWSFLEYQVTREGFVQLPAGFSYAFTETVTRPVAESSPSLQLVMSNLPLPMLGPWLPILVVLVFLFVIIVII